VEVIEVTDDTTDADENGDAEEDDESPTVQERLQLRTFVVSTTSLKSDPRWVKVSDIFQEQKSDAQLLKGLVKSFEDPLFDKYAKRLQKVRRIRDYPYVMHVLDKNLSYEEVAEIFVRVNSLGMKLRGSDLALALITSRWPDSLSLFEAFQEECEEKWFTLDLGLIVRGVVVFATGQSRFKTAGQIPVPVLKQAWKETTEGMQFAINFLRSNAGIEDESLLSSPLFIIAIANFAAKRQFKLSAQDERDLRRWLYVANAKGRYTRGSTETFLDADLAAMNRGENPATLLEILKQQVGRLEIEASDLAGRGKASALFPTTYLALKKAGAKDWRTHLELSLSHQGQEHFIEFHPIFPKTKLKGKFDKGSINEIANMAFVSGGTDRKLSATLPEKYLKDIMDEHGADSLAAHGIPADPSLWSIDDFPKFLEFRRARLTEAINLLIQGGGPDTKIRDVSALISQGENEKTEFKSSARYDYREGKPNKLLESVVAKTIAGFLNNEGGTLLIGVDDKGKSIGLDTDFKTLTKRQDADGYAQFLTNLISATMGKEVCADVAISFPTAEGITICMVQIRKSARPVFVQEGQNERFYLRTGNATQELGVKAANAYIQTHWSSWRDA
jgi:hypothetical protein